MKRKKQPGLLFRYLDTAIEVPGVFIAVFGLTSLILLLFEQLDNALILLLALPAAVMVSYFYAKSSFSQRVKANYDRKQKISILAVFIFAVIWVAFNFYYNSEHVFVNRDPAIYNVTGKILSNQSSLLEIDKYTELEMVEGVTSKSAGFDTSLDNDEKLFAQGAHLFSTMLGITSRFFGDEAMFKLNIIIAGLALLSFFAMARLVLGHHWSLFATIILGICLPFIYFSRDSYTEIITLLLVCSAVVVASTAHRIGGRLTWLLSGVSVGSIALARIDGYIAAALSLAVLAIYINAGVNGGQRKIRLVHALIYALGLGVCLVVALLDIRLLASGYFVSEWPSLKLELLLIGVTTLAGFLFIAGSWKKRPVLELISSRKRNILSKVVFSLIIVVFAIMASRPAWLPGLPDSAEHTISWLAVYLGPAVVALGILGVAFVAKDIVEKKSNITMFMLVTLFLGYALVYLNMPSISPDQVWASRRMLPVIYPALIIFSLYGLVKLIGLAMKRFSIKKNIRYILTGFALTVVAVSPLYMTHRFLDDATFRESDTMNQICARIPEDATIVWLGRAASDATIATRVFCEVRSVGFLQEPSLTKESIRNSLTELKGLVKEKELIVGFYEDDKGLLSTSAGTKVAVKQSLNIETIANRPPKYIVGSQQPVMFVRVEQSGNLTDL